MFRNFVGSFSDAAILFPLLILLGQKTSFQLPLLFLSAGILVIVSGWYFRVPMAVQPLKSIAIAAISVGATAAEIQMSTLLLSGVFFLCLILKFDKWLQMVPENWIHSLQLSLGLLLLLQGIEVSSKIYGGFYLSLFFAVILMYLTWKWNWPFLGILATVALIGALTAALIGTFGLDMNIFSKIEKGFKFGFPIQDLRWPLIMNLLLPQLALTTANSVIATENVSKRYFGKTAHLVTTSRLMGSIAISNFLSALIGGLPMCHGSGGVTALYRGGARHWSSNFYLGGFLIVLTFFSMIYDIHSFQIPTVILGSLLSVVGVYHLLLAKITWKNSKEGKLRLLLAVAIILLTKNLLLVLLTQVLVSLFKSIFKSISFRFESRRL